MSGSARNRNALTYAPGMGVERYIDRGLVARDRAPEAATSAAPLTRPIALPPDAPSIIGDYPVAAPAPVAAGGGGGGGMMAAGGLGLLGSLADPTLIKGAIDLFSGSGAQALGPSLGPNSIHDAGAMSVEALGGPSGGGAGLSSVGSLGPNSIYDAGAMSVADLAGGMPIGEGAAGGLAGAEGAGAAAATSPWAAAAGFAGAALLPLVPFMMAGGFAPEAHQYADAPIRAQGGRAMLGNVTGKHMGLDPFAADVAGDVDYLNGVLGAYGLSMRGDAPALWQEGGTHAMDRNNFLDRVGFRPADYLTANDPAQAQLLSNTAYNGWNEFAGALGAPVEPGRAGDHGYQLSDYDISAGHGLSAPGSYRPDSPLWSGGMPSVGDEGWRDLIVNTMANPVGQQVDMNALNSFVYPLLHGGPEGAAPSAEAMQAAQTFWAHTAGNGGGA